MPDPNTPTPNEADIPTPAPAETPPIQDETDQDVEKMPTPESPNNPPEETVAELTERLMSELAAKVGDNPSISNPVVEEFGRNVARQLAEYQKTTNEATATAARLMAENANLLEQNRLKMFTDEVLGQSKANGTAWVGDIADHVKLSIRLAEKFGEDSWELRHWQTTNRSHAEAIKASFLFKEIGTGRAAEGMNGHERAEIAARTLREQNPNLSKEQAYAQVMKAHPEFYD